MVKPSLIVIAHGSRSKAWTAAVTELVSVMDAEIRGAQEPPFYGCVPAFLENASPSIDEVLERLLQEQAARGGGPPPIALPLLLTNSGHLRDDVPDAIAGRAVQLPPLAPAVWLANNVERRITNLLRQRAATDTGVVLVAYGSTPFANLWDSMLEEVGAALLAGGIGAVSHAYVGHVVGLSPAPTVAASVAMVASNPSLSGVAIIPVLFGRGMLQTGPIQQAADQARQRLSVDILYAADAILPDQALASQLVRHARRLSGATA